MSSGTSAVIWCYSWEQQSPAIIRSRQTKKEHGQRKTKGVNTKRTTNFASRKRYVPSEVEGVESPRWSNFWSCLEKSKSTVPQNRNHTEHQNTSPQHGPNNWTWGIQTSTCTRQQYQVHNQTHSFKSEVLSRKGSGNGRVGQRLASHDLGGVGVMSPSHYPSKEGDNSTKPELNRVQSTTWETSPHGDSGSGPANQNHKAKKPKKSSSKEGEDTDDTGSSLAESDSA